MGTYVSFRLVVSKISRGSRGGYPLAALGKIKAQSSHKFTVAGDTSNKDTVAPTLVRAHA